MKIDGYGYVVLGLLLLQAEAQGIEKTYLPELVIVVDEEAPELERFAAGELRSMLERLFQVDARIEAGPHEGQAALILVGSPSTNPALARVVGRNWPNLSHQGLVLRRIQAVRPTLVVGGGSAAATLWAVYELVERLGVRYLHYRDVYPKKRPWKALPQMDCVMEPNMRIRCWRLINDLAHGPVSWSLEENRRFLRQIAKMKYNRVHMSLWPQQPNIHYSFRGMAKPPGVLFFGLRHPIDEDTIGRERFVGMKVFTNPELVGADSHEEVRRRATELVRAILKEARRLGMETGLSIQPFSWPREFLEALPGSEPHRQLGNLIAGPGSNQSMDDPLLREMVATIVRAYVETYPKVDYLHIGMPEHRSWVGQASEAYRRLDKKYNLAALGSFEELCARARTTFPGGGGRVETMLKGDLSALWFFDSLLRERKLLRRPDDSGDIKLVYSHIAEELLPLVSRILPSGGEIRGFIDYTASRALRRRDLLEQAVAMEVPATLIFTLADDNVGVLPQLATGSLHALMGELRKGGWAGFYTRYWTVGDLDPTIHYLARASWDIQMTPHNAYADQIEHVCGPDSAAPAGKAFAIIEQITLGLDQHGLGFGFPVTGMMTKHYEKGGLSSHLKEDHKHYRRAFEWMQQARQLSRPEGHDYLDYFLGRLRFAVRYLDAAEAFGATARALKEANQAEALQQAESAYQAIREALESYVAVARDHGDLGSVALMNEYCYRPIRDKRREIREMGVSP